MVELFTDEAINCLLFAKMTEEDKKAINLLRRKITEGQLQKAQALATVRKELGE